MGSLTVINGEISGIDSLKEEVRDRVSKITSIAISPSTAVSCNALRIENDKFIKSCQKLVENAKEEDKKKIDKAYENAENQLAEALRPLSDENSSFKEKVNQVIKEKKKANLLSKFVAPLLHGANDLGEVPSEEMFWREGDEKKTEKVAALDYGKRVRVFYGEEPTYDATIVIKGATKQELSDILAFAKEACSGSAEQGPAKMEGE